MSNLSREILNQKIQEVAAYIEAFNERAQQQIEAVHSELKQEADDIWSCVQEEKRLAQPERLKRDEESE